MEVKITIMRNARQSESGFVAIFTVIFFIILVTVLVLSFIRVMLDEQRQSTDNDLTATALNAAEAGVEDGKRLLLYCTQQMMSGGPDASDCQSSLDTTQCPGVFGVAGLANRLGIQSAIEGDGSVRVSNNAGTEQHYTCLIVNPITDDYVGQVDANQSDLLPLKGVDPFDVIEFSWHMTTPDAQKPPKNYSTNTQLPDVATWSAQEYPAYMRLQYLKHEQGDINIADLDDDSRALFLAPSDSPSAVPNVDLNARDSRTGSRTKDQPVLTRCIPRNTNAELYACTVRIQLGSDVVPSSTSAYLRVAALYGASDFRVRLFKGADLVSMDGVQPVIDSTGRSNDVFRRVQSRVRLDGSAFYPLFALESGKDICKHFLVTSTTSGYTDYCGGGGGGGGGGGSSCAPVSIDETTFLGDPTGHYHLIDWQPSRRTYTHSPSILNDIKAGCMYNITVQTADYSHPHSPPYEQYEERLSVWFYKNGTELAHTGLTDDFPDSVQHSPIKDMGNFCFTDTPDTLTYKGYYATTGILAGASSVQPYKIVMTPVASC